MLQNFSNNSESNNTIKVNAAIIEALNHIHAATYAHIEYMGTEKCPKKLGLAGEVTKRVSGSVQLFYSYENAVNNRLEAEGKERTFEAQGLRGKSWLIYNKLLVSGKNILLRCYRYNGGKLETEYFVAGRPATADEITLIKAWKASKSSGSRAQEAAGLTDNQVRPFDVNVKNIITLQAGKCQYFAPAEKESEAQAQ
jgi:hypothetical protein